MKTSCTHSIPLKSILLFFILSISGLSMFSQPDYDFRNASLVSGSSNQLNAVYLFQNVKPGVDATVTIKDITGGISLDDIDGGSGYAEALQPVLHVPAFASGYIEFEINFLEAGTSIPMIQTEIPATPIDIDGQNYSDGTVKEFDILQLTNGYVDFDMLGGELSMNVSSSWATGMNISGIDYPGVDTTPRQVMFTTVNAGISSFTFRTGATSGASGAHQRLRSLYFKKFLYPNSMLAIPSLSFFKGTAADSRVSLEWKIASNGIIKNIVIERGTSASQFIGVGEKQINTSLNADGLYTFTDAPATQGPIYYRLKMNHADNSISYSNILLFHFDEKESFTIYPSVINSSARLNISADKNSATVLQFTDLQGRIAYKTSLAVQQGNNNIEINGLGNLQKGVYVASISTGKTVQCRKVIIQ